MNEARTMPNNKNKSAWKLIANEKCNLEWTDMYKNSIKLMGKVFQGPHN